MSNIFERIADAVREDVLFDLKHGVIEPILITDSPIEAAFLIAVQVYAAFAHPGFDVCPSDGPDIFTKSLRVEAQKQIGKYRVDFCLSVLPYSPSSYKGAWVNKEEFSDPVFLVVECDGHDYHERTPEQAARDRSRDRKLQMEGYTVFRFTGREIHRDPWGCARQVFDWAHKARFSLDPNPTEDF